MAGFFGFIVAHEHEFLDQEFDAPDLVADHDLCRAIAVGKAGLHPDGWGNHDPLTLLPPHFREPWEPPVGIPAEQAPRSLGWPKPKPKPQPKPQPKPKPQWHPHTPSDQPAHGEVQLTCDDCEARFRVTMYYRGNRPAVVAAIRLLGKDEGWTCIVGRDRCPSCSQLVPPQAIGNGAGGHQGDEQHP